MTSERNETMRNLFNGVLLRPLPYGRGSVGVVAARFSVGAVVYRIPDGAGGELDSTPRQLQGQRIDGTSGISFCDNTDEVVEN
jgi:hypothetical protein